MSFQNSEPYRELKQEMTSHRQPHQFSGISLVYLLSIQLSDVHFFYDIYILSGLFVAVLVVIGHIGRKKQFADAEKLEAANIPLTLLLMAVSA